MTYDELAILNTKLDTIQDHLIAQDNLIKVTMEHIEEYLVWVDNEIERLSKPVNIQDVYERGL